MQLVVLRAVDAHDRDEQLLDSRQLRAQPVVMGHDDVVAQLGDRGAPPVVLLQAPPIE